MEDKIIPRGNNHKVDCRCKICISDLVGENNPTWKGDEAGYAAIHNWVRRRKPKPQLCEKCKVKPPQELSNISQQYKRDVEDFWWLCKTCHAEFDGYNKKGHKGKDYKESIGESNGRAKLNNKKVYEIKELLRKGELTKTEIAKMYDVSLYPISAIARGKLWKHLN